MIGGGWCGFETQALCVSIAGRPRRLTILVPPRASLKDREPAAHGHKLAAKPPSPPYFRQGPVHRSSAQRVEPAHNHRGREASGALTCSTRNGDLQPLHSISDTRSINASIIKQENRYTAICSSYILPTTTTPVAAQYPAVPPGTIVLLRRINIRTRTHPFPSPTPNLPGSGLNQAIV